MKVNPKIVAFVCVLAVGGTVSGCANKSEGTVTKAEEAEFRGPRDRPMPAQAAAAMQKMNQGSNAPLPGAAVGGSPAPVKP